MRSTAECVPYAFGVCAAIAMLAACNSAGSQLAPPRPLQQSMLGPSSNAQMSADSTVRRFARAAPHAFPGKNGRIAFLHGIAGDGGGDVYTMNSDGSHLRQLTHYGPGFKNAAIWDAWSPNGREIVFSVNPTNSLAGRLWIMNSDGSHQRRIFNDPGFSDVFPSFSPDGKRVIFARQDLSYYAIAIYRVDVDGRGLKAITHLRSEVDDIRPEYSPDGTRVEFETENRDGFERVIALCTADGSDIRPITPPQRGAWGADWSPDGRRLVFGTYFHTTFGQNEEIWSMSLDDGRLYQLTKNNYKGQISYYAEPHDEFPAWSPDGTAIVFERQNATLKSSGLFVITNHGGTWAEKQLLPPGLPSIPEGLGSSPMVGLASAGYLAARRGLNRIEKNGEVPKWGTAPNL
jgi:Tol biopolymer transport system component